ncbi:endoribonuclease YBEY, chloroplastic [Arachis stenosperma]|uniref:endoribonuclease YBEY, chloroplastic n=1 Tax=Arachis stenosperma TaxID=217475 RepID=UPI0025ACF53A|nr:endoribonuclease YBEY, chloroplastic [Arachis stenosperma]
MWDCGERRKLRNGDAGRSWYPQGHQKDIGVRGECHVLNVTSESYLVHDMLPRFSQLLLRPHSQSHLQRIMPRAITCSTQCHYTSSSSSHYSPFATPSNSRRSSLSLPSKCSSLFARGFHALCERNEAKKKRLGLVGAVRAGQREYRKLRRRAPKAKAKPKELELCVDICIEEDLPDDPEVLSIAELLRLNAPMAMKLAFDGLKDSRYKTRDAAIDDVGGFESVELSLLLCNDEFIRKLNKEWRDEDHATDVLSMSQHIPGLKLPILMLGDIVISVETAARQAEERGHTLVDEIRILMVHGLLHLLGFDHELSEEAEVEMEKEEELLLKSLGWKGKGLIKSTHEAEINSTSHHHSSDDQLSKDRKKDGSLRFYKPKFSYIFCDMDGTLLNSKSQISPATAQALRKATSRGVKIVIATGKARPAVIDVFKMVDLAGKDGIVSEFSPGVFLQGLLVYGRQGKEIFRSNLDLSVCREACLYSLENKIPLIAFCEGRCLTLFHDPLVDSLHTTYHEPKAEIMPSIEHLLASADIQKMIFLDTAKSVASTIRPYWSEATKDRATVVQAVPDMLEIVPLGTSKGNGVKILLDHLGVTPKEIMAIGDGENDVEMLELASVGIALSNGAEKTKAVANIIGCSNDEDGVADAIYRYAF